MRSDPGYVVGQRRAGLDLHREVLGADYVARQLTALIDEEPDLVVHEVVGQQQRVVDVAETQARRAGDDEENAPPPEAVAAEAPVVVRVDVYGLGRLAAVELRIGTDAGRWGDVAPARD